jgi:hypothetical protein
LSVASLNVVDDIKSVTQRHEQNISQPEELSKHLTPLIDESPENLTDFQCQKLSALLIQYKDIFTDESGTVGHTNLVELT